MNDKHVQPYVEIVEQPANRAIRFLYESEKHGKNLGIPGANSTIQNRTYPTIRIVGKKGPARVVISCVTNDPPYRPHPHSLQYKQESYHGVCIIEIPSKSSVVNFPDLTIQCIKKGTVEEALKIRENLQIDPFKTGFGHANNQFEIDFRALRLCFQVFLEGSRKDKFNVALPPVVSDPIYDRRAMPDLVIRQLCEYTAPVAGGKRMILLCEKILKDDIQIRFFEEKNGQLFWEGYGEFHRTQIHKRTAISFKTPRYYTQEVEEPVEMFVELRRSVDGISSERVPFQMLPVGADDASSLKRKRRKFNRDENSILSNISKYLKLGKSATTLENIVEIPNTDAQDFDQYAKSYLQSHNNTQVQRPEVSPEQMPQVSPEQMPSIIEDDTFNTYNLLQPQYEGNVQSIIQEPNIPATMNPSLYVPNQSQYNLPENKSFESEINLLISNELETQEGLQLINNTQNQSLQMSPEQTSSHMEHSTYRPSFTQQQYQLDSDTIIQQSNMSAVTNVQTPSYVENQSQLYQRQNLLILNKETSESQGQLQPINNTSAECLLNMDDKQMGFHSNYFDITDDTGRNLSKSLSELSISDVR